MELLIRKLLFQWLVREIAHNILTIPSSFGRAPATAEDWGQSKFQWGGELGPAPSPGFCALACGFYF